MDNNTSTNPNEKNKNSKALLMTIIGVLVALNAGLLYMWQKGGKENQDLEKTNKTANTENKELKAALADADHMLNKFRVDSATMADKHKELGAEVVARKNEIAALVAKLRNTQVADAKDIAELKQKMAEMQEVITRLEGENADLKDKNVKLDEERGRLEKANEEISTKYTAESAEKKKFKGLAQSLKTESLKVEALKKRWLTGKEAVTSKAKDVESIKTTFRIAENKVAESGERTIFIKITGPEGVTIMNPGNQGGTFEFENNESNYTYKVTTIFDQESKQVEPSVWRPASELKPGKYTVELYSDGNKMGSTSFNLK